jgi:S-formylglutathione hydrolase FrmB
VTRRRILSCAAAGAIALTAGCTSTAPDRASSPTPSPTTVSIVSTTHVSSRLVDLTINSPALKAKARVRLILPHDFASAPTQRWPVLYLLHGCCDTYQSWSRNTDIVKFFGNRNVLVVMPDGGKIGFYSDWRLGPHWETFHTGELRTLLEQRYRAGSRRAIAGLSMGGLGALDYTARHPDLFSAAASFSGMVDSRLDPSVTSAYQGLVQSNGEDPDDLWGDPDKNAAIWRAHNPADLTARLGKTPVFVSSGTGAPGPLDKREQSADSTEQFIYAQNRVFAPKLRAADRNARIDLYGPGTHSWPYWQREFHRSWPLLAAALGVT